MHLTPNWPVCDVTSRFVDESFRVPIILSIEASTNQIGPQLGVHGDTINILLAN